MIAGHRKIPLISRIAFTRGWYFIIAWCHRASGLLLLIFVSLHISDLASRAAKVAPGESLQVARSGLVSFLVWLLAFPLIFHALNGGRLLLYESFGKRNDEAMVRWVFTLSAMYLGVLGLVMTSNQTASPIFFWVCLSLVGIVLAYAVGTRVLKTDHTLFWKLQRISGAYMVSTVPAYVMSRYLRAPGSHGWDVGMAGLQSLVGKVLFLFVLLCVVYHGGYGLFSVIRDFGASRVVKGVVTVLIIWMAIMIGALGVKVIMSV